MLNLHHIFCVLCYNRIIKKKKGMRKIYKEIIQQKLIKAREEIGYTQREVASLIDESQSKIAKIESGKQMPDVEIIGKLAELYEVTIDWIFGVGQKTRK